MNNYKAGSARNSTKLKKQNAAIILEACSVPSHQNSLLFRRSDRSPNPGVIITTAQATLDHILNFVFKKYYRNSMKLYVFF